MHTDGATTPFKVQLNSNVTAVDMKQLNAMILFYLRTTEVNSLKNSLKRHFEEKSINNVTINSVLPRRSQIHDNEKLRLFYH